MEFYKFTQKITEKLKNTLLSLALFAFILGHAQINSSAPWMQKFNTQKKQSKLKFQDVVDEFKLYWQDKDPTVKGSGYKPFKRWETYWQNFVDTDGYLPSHEDYWNSWNNVLSQRSSSAINTDESNWLPLGPTDFLSRPTNVANIGRINVIIKDPNNENIYYAGAPSGGIWKSIDSGVSWIPLADELPQIGVSGIAIDYADSNTIYIATGDDDSNDSYSVGVFKSTDGGQTWSATGTIPPPGSFSSLSMNDIYIHPTNSNILWVATNNGVYKTSNAGVSWVQTLSGEIKDIKLKPGDPNTVYCVRNDNLGSSSTYRFYKSKNGGDSFNLSNIGISSGSKRMAIDVTEANPEVVYILSAGNSWEYQAVYKSVNSGSSFETTLNTTNIFESTQAWFDMAFAVSDTDEDKIFVGVLNIWSSSDGGDTFTKLNNWNIRDEAYTHADIHFLRFYDGELFTGTDGGFFKSSNNGTTFTDLTTGMQISQFYRIDVSKQTVNRIAGGTQDNGGFGYDDQWNNYHGGDGMEGVIDPNNDNNYFGFMQNGTALFYSSTAGQGPTFGYYGAELNANNQGTGNWITPLAFNNESELYAGYSKLYKFNSNSWLEISPSFNTNIDVLEIDDVNPDNIYVGINTSLRKSTDRGVSFTYATTFNSNITSIEVNNNDSDIIYVTTAGFSGGVYKSTDGGFNFTEITGNLPVSAKNTIKHRAEDPINTLFLGTHIGVYTYNDTTQSWEDFNTNLPNTSVRDLAINVLENKIVAGTYGRGIWISNMSAVQEVTDDIRLESLANPVSLSTQCGDFSPEVTVINNGQNVINSITVNYSIDGGAINTTTWNGTLNSDETTNISLPNQSLSKGEHTIMVETTIANDAFPANNTKTVTFFTNESGDIGTINQFENPEDSLLTNNLEGGISVWERGEPTGANLNTAYSGTNVYATNLDGNHPNNSISYLYTDCYNLTYVQNPVLKFRLAFEIEQDWDILYVEYSTNEGEDWTLLGSEAPNWYNSSRIAGDGIANDCYNCVGGQWTGTDLDLKQYFYNLNALNNESSVIFRFVYHADQLENFEGAVIDDLFVDGTLSSPDAVQASFSVYPNPSNSIFNIRTSQSTQYNLNVTDITGKRIITESKINSSQNNHRLDLSNFSSGIYLLTIESEGRFITRKLIKN